MKVAADHQPGAGQPDTTELLRVLDAGLSPGLLERALTHRSYAYENGGLPTNERLEFLGDSVLGLVVTDALFRGYPDLPEGPPGQAARGRGQHAGAGRRRPWPAARRLRAARAGRGRHRRPGQVLDSRRHPGSRDRRGLHRARPGRGVRARAPAVRPGHRAVRPARRRPGLEDLAAGTHRVRGARRARVSRRGERPGPPEVVPRPGPGGRPRVRQRGGAVQEGGRAAGRRGRVERHQQRRVSAPAPPPVDSPPPAGGPATLGRAAPHGAGEAGRRARPGG